MWMDNLDKLSQVYEIAIQVPTLKIIIGHMGLPGSMSKVLPDFTRWASIMSDLARLPNVYAKVSVAMVGLDDLRPYFQHTLRSFGFSRCMYGSNWYPVNDSPGFLSARAWAEAVTMYMTEIGASDDDAHWLLHKTAELVYSLEPL
jgi:predicted TIM-barrel fold metal-dependent hydrolase